MTWIYLVWIIIMIVEGHNLDLGKCLALGPSLVHIEESDIFRINDDVSLSDDDDNWGIWSLVGCILLMIQTQHFNTGPWLRSQHLLLHGWLVTAVQC